MGLLWAPGDGSDVKKKRVTANPQGTAESLVASGQSKPCRQSRFLPDQPLDQSGPSGPWEGQRELVHARKPRIGEGGAIPVGTRNGAKTNGVFRNDGPGETCGHGSPCALLSPEWTDDDGWSGYASEQTDCVLLCPLPWFLGVVVRQSGQVEHDTVTIQ